MSKLLLALLITSTLGQIQNNGTQHPTTPPATLITNNSYVKDTVVGIAILATIFLVAYLFGRTGHRAMQSQIDQQLTQIRQTEEENQTSDEREIAEHIKQHPIDTNELHMPDDYKPSLWRVLVVRVGQAFSSVYRYRWTTANEQKQLKHQEMFNQFEFEDSI